MRPRAARAACAGAAVALPLLAVPLAGGCGGGASSTYDSYPIPLTRAPMGGGFPGDGPLVALAADPDNPDATYPMVVDTGSPLTARAGLLEAQLATFTGGFDLYDATSALSPPPMRASFSGLDMLRLPLRAIGDGSVTPQGVLGGDVLRGYSVAFRFGAACTRAGAPALCSAMTLWSHMGADQSFLEDAGFAVYRFTLYGGGEVTAQGSADFVGISGPLVLPATRVLLRTCAVPDAFDPSTATLANDCCGAGASLACCSSTDAADLGAAPNRVPLAAGTVPATGINLSLLLATGVGPVILSQSAFDRVRAAIVGTAVPAIPDPVALGPSLYVATWSGAINASWSTIPRLAFVDLEAGAAADPGACVELGRARRTEQVSFATVAQPTVATCGVPCDADSHQPNLAQSSAAYLELGGQIPVAVVADDEPFLQALRFDVRPEGPEVDGLVGAGALGRARAEIDYLSSQPQILFSCEPEATRAECWAAPRCPRLPDETSIHYCFDLPAHHLGAGCDQQMTCPAATTSSP